MNVRKEEIAGSERGSAAGRSMGRMKITLALTATYMIADRRFEDGVKIDNKQKGNLLRLQMQFNY